MKTRCEDCEESWSWGVAPARCHIDEDGDHCHAGPCEGGDHA
jgi:hypothetical protein